MQGIHGNVFVNSTILGRDGNNTFVRLLSNLGGVLPWWPYSEVVMINTRTQGIAPVGWGPIQGPPYPDQHLHLWEYNNSMDLDGRPIDTSQRLNITQQLTLPQNASIIEAYTDSVNVLGGWAPVVLS